MSDIRVTVEPITAELLAQVEHLYVLEPFKATLWAWQFKARFGRIPLAVVAWDGKNIIGFNGTMPARLVTKTGSVIDATWSCDFIVAEAYRGKGIGSAIKNKMFSSLDKPIMSLGISDNAYPLLIKKGGISPSSLNVYHLVNRANGVKQQLFKYYSITRKLFSGRSIKNAIKYYQVEELAGLPESCVIDPLSELQRKQSDGNEIFRDREYLHWRYAEVPFAATTYRFLAVSPKGLGICALVVFRSGKNDSIEVVDFLGDLAQPHLIFAICHYFKKKFASACLFTWNTSSRRIAQCLSDYGFMRKSYRTRFIAFIDNDDTNWNLLAGDSDGDFLYCAKEHFVQQSQTDKSQHQVHSDESAGGAFMVRSPQWICNSGYEFHCIDSIEDFSTLKDEWHSLIKHADANPLFMGWTWQYSWWLVWGEKLRLLLSIIVIIKENKICGIVPLYRYKKYGINYFQFVGNAWGFAQTVRSEYISPIFLFEHECILDKSFAKFFKRYNPDAILVVPDTNKIFFNDLKSLLLKQDVGYRIATNSNFSVYLKSLGRLTRLKAFGRRRQLVDQGEEIVLQSMSIETEQIDSFFSQLNSFHLIRWGKPCFNAEAVEFHKNVLLNRVSMTPNLSALFIQNKLVSLSYNIKCQEVMYNIQSGYLEHFDKKVSLGTMHMGWEIEHSFQDEGIVTFDFLAGYGKVEDYKRHYRGEQVDFYTRQYFSSHPMYWGAYIILCIKRYFKWSRDITKKFITSRVD